MRETQIIEKIKQLAAAAHHDKELVQGIGDDCAILRPRLKEDLVFTCDFVMQGRHFTRKTHKAADVGHLALARSLSDLAAMGSEPAFCLVSLAVPATLGPRWIEQFYEGLLPLASRCKVMLAGGDLARFERIVANVTCCGRVPRGKAMRRNAAKPGDRIYVTGLLGAAAHALSAGHAVRRPEPRIREGVALRRLGVCAGMDLSDGLALDLHRLCAESGVHAELHAKIPVAPGATLDQALHGGEDYELLFTASRRTWIPRKIDELAVTRIGIIRPGHAGQVRYDGRWLQPKGFDHFDESSR